MGLLQLLNPRDSLVAWAFLTIIVGLAAGTIGTGISSVERYRLKSTSDNEWDDEILPSVDEISSRLKHSGDRYLEAVPGVMLILGLLGTFIGLALAIQGASAALGGVASSSQQVTQQAAKLQVLLGTLGVKFQTSIYGVTGSLFARTVAGAWVAPSRIAAAKALRDRIARKVRARRATQEATLEGALAALIGIRTSMESQKDLAEHLDTLPTRISESVRTLVASGERLAGSADAFSKTVEAMDRHSGEVFDALGGRLQKAIAESAAGQLEVLNKLPRAIDESMGLQHKAQAAMSAHFVDRMAVERQNRTESLEALRTANEAYHKSLGQEREAMASWHVQSRERADALAVEIAQELKAMRETNAQTTKSMRESLSAVRKTVTASEHAIAAMLPIPAAVVEGIERLGHAVESMPDRVGTGLEPVQRALSGLRDAAEGEMSTRAEMASRLADIGRLLVSIESRSADLAPVAAAVQQLVLWSQQYASGRMEAGQFDLIVSTLLSIREHLARLPDRSTLHE